MSRKYTPAAIDSLLEKATIFCLKQKQRLTKPRLEVLKILATSSKPLGAYEILQKLGKVLPNPKPPTAYRAIDFWLEWDFIHRIESLNAYMLCHAGHRHRGSQFMICDDCGAVAEVHVCKLPQTLQQVVSKSHFSCSSWNVEIRGICADCDPGEL